MSPYIPPPLPPPDLPPLLPFSLTPHWSVRSGLAADCDCSLTPAGHEQALPANWKTADWSAGLETALSGYTHTHTQINTPPHKHQSEMGGLLRFSGCVRPEGNSSQSRHWEKWEMWLSPRHKSDVLCLLVCACVRCVCLCRVRRVCLCLHARTHTPHLLM